MTYRPAPPRRAQPPEACARCGFALRPLVPGIYLHATTAGAAACKITWRLDQLTADGWTLSAPTRKGHRRP